jgi:hypothetical protein
MPLNPLALAITAVTTRNGRGAAWIASGLIAALSLAGSAGAQTYAVPTTGVTKAYELEGYSVLPPSGKDWFEMGRDKQQVLFGKRIESRTHSFGATATSGVIIEKFETREQFQDYVNKMRFSDLGSDRYKVLEFSSDFDPAFPAWCVRYRAKTQDRAAPFSVGRVLLFEHIGVTCLHPTIPELVVDVGYSERGRPAEISVELRGEGESFMRSLKFTPRQ